MMGAVLFAMPLSPWNKLRSLDARCRGHLPLQWRDKEQKPVSKTPRNYARKPRPGP